MALIIEPRVRETSNVVGVGNIVLTGRMYASLSFDEVMNNGDTSYVSISYQDSFEECGVTFNGTDLVRGACIRSRHADGTVDQSHVSFPAGIKTVVMVYPSSGIGALDAYAVRFTAQTPTSGQQDQARANINSLRDMASGTIQLFGAASPPVGWTKLTDHNDKAIRVVTGTPSSGGSIDFSSCFGRTATDPFSVAQGNLPSFTLPDTLGIADTKTFATTNAYYPQNGVGPFGLGAGANAGLAGAAPVGVTGGAISKTGTVTSGGSNAALQAGMDIRTKYVDVIRASKN